MALNYEVGGSKKYIFDKAKGYSNDEKEPFVTIKPEAEYNPIERDLTEVS